MSFILICWCDASVILGQPKTSARTTKVQGNRFPQAPTECERKQHIEEHVCEDTKYYSDPRLTLGGTSFILSGEGCNIPTMLPSHNNQPAHTTTTLTHNITPTHSHIFKHVLFPPLLFICFVLSFCFIPSRCHLRRLSSSDSTLLACLFLRCSGSPWVSLRRSPVVTVVCNPR